MICLRCLVSFLAGFLTGLLILGLVWFWCAGEEEPPRVLPEAGRWEPTRGWLRVEISTRARPCDAWTSEAPGR
jgi:hypothetical protein